MSDAESKVLIHPSVIHLGSQISVGRNSELIIEEGVNVSGSIVITDN